MKLCTQFIFQVNGWCLTYCLFRINYCFYWLFLIVLFSYYVKWNMDFWFIYLIYNRLRPWESKFVWNYSFIISIKPQIMASGEINSQFELFISLWSIMVHCGNDHILFISIFGQKNEFNGFSWIMVDWYRFKYLIQNLTFLFQ